MSAWALFFVFVGGVVVLAILGLLLARRFLGTWRSVEDSGHVAGVARMVLTVFALVLAFAIGSLYNVHRDAGSAITREANDWAQVRRDVNAVWPDAKSPEAAAVRNAVTPYLRVVTGKEFSDMRNGDDSGTETAGRLSAIFVTVEGLHPDGPSQTAFYNGAVGALADAAAQRRSRLGLVNAALPGPFTALLLLTAAMSIVMTWFVRTRDPRIEFVLVGAVAIVVGSGMLTVLLLQFPFSGSIAVSSAPLCQGFLPSSYCP
jgi:hypothetical protein